MARAALIVAVCLLAVLPAQAQVRPAFDLNFIMGIPQGEFDEHVGTLGYGIEAFGGIGVGQTPVVLGLSLGGMIYGYEHRKEPFSPTIPDVTVDVKTSNNIFMGHFVLRLQPPTGAFRPYLDGLVGLKYLFTETRIESERFDNDEPIAASTNFDDVAFSYGAGGGLDLRLYDGPLGEHKKPVSIALNIGFRYLLGSEAEYLKEGSIRRGNGKVTYEVERSRTDLLVPHLGVRFAF